MLVCSPWLTEADLPADRPVLPAGVTWADLITAASDLLYVLSGRQWAGAGCRAEFVYDGPTTITRLPGTGDILDVSGRATNSWFACDGEIRLPDKAGVTIESVTVGETTVDPAGYEVRRGWLLRTGGSWPAGTVVTYSYGLDPPAGGKVAATRYAVELAKAWCGDKSCALPARVRSIVRQGVSIEVADPMVFLDKGRTGITDVDGWLAAINPGGKRRRPGVWTPETAVRGRRRELTPGP